MLTTLMQRTYFVAAIAPLVAAVLFTGGTGAAGAGAALACVVPTGPVASEGHAGADTSRDADTTARGYDGGGYGY